MKPGGIGNLLRISCVLAQLGAADPARADPALPPWAGEPLSITRCAELALRDAPTQQLLSARIRSAEAAVKLARTVPNPVFSYIAQDLGLVTPGGPALLHQQALSFPILFAYARQKEAQVAQAALLQTTAAVTEERRQIRRAVGRAYLDAVLAARLLAVEERAAQLAATLVASAERRVQHGDSGSIEITRARAEELMAQRDVEQSRRRSDLARLSLSLLLGAEQPFMVHLSEAAITPEDLAALPPASERTAAAWNNRPDLRSAQATLDRARLQLQLEARRQVPLADLQLVAGARVSAAGTGGLLALSLPVPLFDHNAGPLLAARAQVEAARAALVLRERQIAHELASAEREWQGARDALTRLARPLVLLREQAQHAAERQFAEGMLSLLDAITAQRDRLAAERSLAQAERDASVAAWELRIALAVD